MEGKLIIENELYNSFHTQTHCCNLWLCHGMILALRFFNVIQIALDYCTTHQPPPVFFLLFSLFSCNQVLLIQTFFS